MFSQLFWTTKCSLGEGTLARNDLIQCSYRSHLTELARKETFNTDLEITSREIHSHLQVLDILVNKPLKFNIKSNLSEYDYSMNGVVWLETMAQKKFPATTSYIVKVLVEMKMKMIETQNVTFMIKKIKDCEEFQ